MSTDRDLASEFEAMSIRISRRMGKWWSWFLLDGEGSHVSWHPERLHGLEPTLKSPLRRFAALVLRPLWAHARRRGTLSQLLARAGATYHRNFEEGRWGFEVNGEQDLAIALARLGALDIVFDVGANIGDWSATVLRTAPTARIHAFEIAPPTFAKLQGRFNDEPRVAVNAFGLADRAGEVEIDFFPEHASITSLVDGVAGGIHADHSERRQVKVETGDAYCAWRRIERIDLLKIDVEGAEHLVLHGFERMLRERRIEVIQFEYGLANIYTHHLLLDYYRDLGGLGYRIGKLRSRGVEFRDYAPTHENFIGPNFVAVLRDRGDLIRALLCDG